MPPAARRDIDDRAAGRRQRPDHARRGRSVPLRGRKGQRLVVAAKARQLIPYLADAVPGWFQATLALSTAPGNELAYADDFRFDPIRCCTTSFPKTASTCSKFTTRSIAAARISSIASRLANCRSSRAFSRSADRPARKPRSR